MSGDYKLEDSVYILFTTRAFATGIPGVLSASTVAVYEDVTATPIETAIAVTETLNSINGLNAVTIAALAASGYNAGGHYHVVIEAGTVDSVSVVGEVVGSFSIQSSPVNWAKVTAPTTAVDLSATDIQLADTTTTLTTKTGFSLSATGLDAIASTATGMVEIAKAIWDRVLSGGTHNIATSAGRRLRTLQTGGNYEGGQVWVDTVNGTAGTTTDENGVVTNPVDTWADALTLAAAIPLKAFHIANGSTVTLSAASANYVLDGHEWTLALGGFSVASSMFIDASVSGTGTGTDSEYEQCIFAITSLPPMLAYDCSFTATTSGGFTMSAAGDYRFINCQSGVAGSGAPLFTLGTGAISAEFRRWSGGITVAGISTDDTLTIGGEMGTITLGGADGTVEIRGTYKAIVDNRTGSPTLNITGAILGGDVAATLADTNELQTDWADAGRLDAILDARMAEASINTTAGAVDVVTLVTTTTTNTDMRGTDSANTTTPPTSAAISDAVWDELLAGHLIADSTGLLLNDWQDGGRLDLILDARMAEASISTTAGAVDSVTLVATTTTNTDMRGTDSAATAASLATAQLDLDIITGATGVVIDAAANNAIADALLDRDMSTGVDSGSTTVRTPRQALRMNRNKVAIAAGTMTVYKEDDATASHTGAVTTTAGNPVTAIDPAGP